MTTSKKRKRFTHDMDELIERSNPSGIWSQALAASYYHDNGNHEKEFYWTQKLANQGVAFAQFNLAVVYKKGKGVTQNNDLAKEWFLKACETIKQREYEQD